MECTGEDRGQTLPEEPHTGRCHFQNPESQFLPYPRTQRSPESGPYLPRAEELKEQRNILIGDQVVAKGVSWRLPVPSFPAQKTQDTSSFCKLEKGSRQGK